MKISQKHILLFLASQFRSQAVNVTLTDEVLGPYDDNAALDEVDAPYETDTDEPMGLKGGGKRPGKSGSKGGYAGGYGGGYVMPPPPETPKPTSKPTSLPETAKPTSKPTHTPPMTGKGKSGSKSGAKYGDGYKSNYEYGYKYDHQHGYNEGYTKKTMKPTPAPAPAPPCPYLTKVRDILPNSVNVINDSSGIESMTTSGLSPIVDDMNVTKEVGIAYGSCFLVPSSFTSATPVVGACEATFEFSSKDSLFIKYKTQFCPGGDANVVFNGVVVAGSGCLCGTEGSIFKGAFIRDKGYVTYDFSTLSDSCGDGGWNDTELDQFSCAP